MKESLATVKEFGAVETIIMLGSVAALALFAKTGADMIKDRPESMPPAVLTTQHDVHTTPELLIGQPISFKRP